MSEKGKMITLKLDEATAARLSLFCKRALIERVEPFSGSEAEARKMFAALDDLGTALEGQGFSPR
jgi:hypothetical protein